MSEIEELIAHLETQETTPTVDRLIRKIKEQDREIERLNIDLTQMNLDSMEEELRLKAELAKVRIVLEHRDGCYNAAEDRVTELKARVKELEELLGEETYAERAAVRHYKRIKELEEGLRECCRMFEWCDTRYGQLLKGK